MIRWLPMLLLVGCGGQKEDSAADDGSDKKQDPNVPEGCDYPKGAVEPMALNEVLYPYAWPSARHFDGRDEPLDLAKARCGKGAIDFDPFDVLMFVSIPAW